ncbi:rRNA small subunit methyltransferase B [Calidifontibacter sp. DB0510]|uniref:rRNA small subunit methyltransferase B n=1 Tax=Metallococcus carri TaxID=1656884 RepID=A0A967B3J1_9MICO|nr:transcription antitermination factor NusB [Metallococcus carri]NHN55002.1 rRNA small subunit methyltransferase B [Metallococcus carri]NOP37348.1 rRNA small subunit methyltransferase B [Calidifontibacter sp. DB2511S]
MADERRGGSRDDRRGGGGRSGGRRDDDRRESREQREERFRTERRDDRGRQRSQARRGNQGYRSAAAPSQRRRAGDPARRAAWDVLRAVDDGAYANLELPKLLRHNGIGGRDAAFASELCYGSLRMRGFYDAVIERAAGRPVSQIDAPVLSTMRLGAHQLLGMRVPSHAAASETVALAREVNGAGAAGFVNAVLRRISERSREDWVAEVTGGLSGDAALAIEHSHPEWIVRALRTSLGEQAAELEDLLVADNEPAAVSLVARPGLATVDELVAAGAVASSMSPVAATWEGDPGALPAVRETRAAVQDEGSQLLALAMAAVPGTGRDHEEWLDLCAGPGGKAALLATLAHEQGAVLFANEVNPKRTELVRRTMAAALDAGAEVMIGTGDGRELGGEEPDTYDRVLVDAPCTGLGALRRRPEARWRKTVADLGDLTVLQGELLDSAIRATRPGGVIGYATCSPHLAETVQVVRDALTAHPEVTAEDARPYFRAADGSAIEGVGDGPWVQLWPHRHHTDAMFFALLRKSPVAQPDSES